MDRHEHYMSRCLKLAKLASSNVRTNPNVGALLVYNDRVIGEGFHKYYGGPHAEVEAIKSVNKNDAHLIKHATLYVTLEPCNFHGKTPACTLLIQEHQIKKLVVGCCDPNPKIAGSSLQLLKSEGIEVIEGVLQKDCKSLINPFRINILESRPYITLKFAQSKDFFISKKGEQTWLSNSYSKILSHKLRSQSNAILIGTNTALIDNPELTNRLYLGGSPLRIVIDRFNKIDKNSQLLSDEKETLIITEKSRIDANNLMKEQWEFTFDEGLNEKLMKKLYSEKNIGRLIVEGGAKTITTFMKSQMWDEALVITTEKELKEGIKAPRIEGKLISRFDLADNSVTMIRRER